MKPELVQNKYYKLKRCIKRIVKLSRSLIKKNIEFTPASICHDFVKVQRHIADETNSFIETCLNMIDLEKIVPNHMMVEMSANLDKIKFLTSDSLKVGNANGKKLSKIDIQKILQNKPLMNKIRNELCTDTSLTEWKKDLLTAAKDSKK